MNPRRNRAPKNMSEKRLRNIAIWYCERYLVSSEKLAHYLKKRLYRDVRDDEERARFSELIPSIVTDLVALGHADDREAASARLRSALRSGYAKETAVAIAASSAMVEREIVESELDNALIQALPELENIGLVETESATSQAILALKRAQRGPFRLSDQNDKSRRRDVAWLQRRGFRMYAIKMALDIDLLDE